VNKDQKTKSKTKNTDDGKSKFKPQSKSKVKAATKSKKKSKKHNSLEKNSSHKKKKKSNHRPKNQRKVAITKDGVKRIFKSDPDRVRVIPLGGLEEVGRNMIVIEVGNDILVSDVGFEFTSDELSPGVDYILPCTKYLEDRKSKIKGVFITHGHLDHIGGVPFIMERIGNPPIYTCKLTARLITKRQEEFPGKPKLKIREIRHYDRVKVGDTYVDIFPVTHSIPDSVGLKIESPQGNIVISGDLKLDHDDGVPSAQEKKVFDNLESEDNLFFVADSTNAERPGFSITENEVAENIADHIRRISGRIIIGTFASQLSRIIAILKACEETGRKVVLEGRSIVNNIQIAMDIGLAKINPDLIIEANELRNYDPEKILVLATGAQGEEFAALRRFAIGRHKYVKLNSNDTVLLSSSVIPGNERSVQKLRDLLFHNGLEIITYKTSDIHSTGHGNIGELLWINRKVGAKYFMPGYGFRSMTFKHAEAVIEDGFPRENVVLGENGTIIDFIDGQMKVGKEKLDMELVVVDGDFIGSIEPHIIEERQVMSDGGIFMLILRITSKKKLKVPAEIVTRGAPLPKNPAKIMMSVQQIVNHVVASAPLGKGSRKYEKMRNGIQKQISEYILKQTRKRPLIEVIIIES
tara:strand:+ start:114 stop:2021 length:1908 start_codon:yes stop_codon:yes gene_type:complete